MTLATIKKDSPKILELSDWFLLVFMTSKLCLKAPNKFALQDQSTSLKSLFFKLCLFSLFLV